MEGGQTYIFVSYGLKPTGGYSVRICRIDSSGDKKLSARVVFTSPTKDLATTQQPTRPYDLVVVRDTGWTVELLPEGSGRPLRVAALAGTGEVQPIVCQSRAIKIFSPAPGRMVNRTFEVSGLALVFEGTIQIRLSAERNGEVVRTFTTAATAMDWGYFRKPLVVPDSVASGSVIGLDLFTVDEEKGGETNLARMSLTVR
jgi:hypothetical protein